MKKVIFILAGALAVGLAVFGVFRLQATAGEPEMTVDQARTQAENQYNATVTEIELDRTGNEPEYHLELENGSKLFSLTLNGNTGEVLSLSETQRDLFEDTAESENSTASVEDENTATSEGTKSEENDSGKSSQNQVASEAEVKITIDEAAEIAANEIGGTVADIEFDEEDGLPIYEAEVETADKEAEVIINAQSGEIVTITYDED